MKARKTRKRDALPEPMFSQKLQKEVYVVDDPVMYARVLEKTEGKTVYYDAEVSLLKRHSAETITQIDMVKQVFPESIVVDIIKRGERRWKS